MFPRPISCLGALLLSWGLTLPSAADAQAPFRTSDPLLQVHLLALAETDVIKKENEQPVPLVNITHMKRGQTVTDGEPVFFFPFFAFAHPDGQGGVSVSCEFTFTNPQGVIILHNVKRICYQSVPPVGTRGPFQTDSPIVMQPDPTDPLGTYTASVKVTDNNTGQTAVDTVVFVLDP